MNENTKPGMLKVLSGFPIVPISALRYSESLVIVPLVGYSMSEAR